jgi:hypothetical protein
MGWLVDQTWSQRFSQLGSTDWLRKDSRIHGCGLPTSEPYTWWEYGFSMCCWFVISQIGLFCQAEWGGPEVKPRSFASPIEIKGGQGNCELGFPTQKDGYTVIQCLLIVSLLLYVIVGLHFTPPVLLLMSDWKTKCFHPNPRRKAFFIGAGSSLRCSSPSFQWATALRTPLRAESKGACAKVVPVCFKCQD